MNATPKTKLRPVPPLVFFAVVLAYALFCLALFAVVAPPTALSIAPMIQTNCSVRLAWEAVTDAVVAGYHIQLGYDSGAETNAIFTVWGRTNNSLTISNLSNARWNYFTATTFASNNAESAPSAELPYYIGVADVVVSIRAPVGSNVVLQAAPSPERAAPWLGFVTNTVPFTVTNPINSGEQFYRFATQ
jgi:hypothetical protein